MKLSKKSKNENRRSIGTAKKLNFLCLHKIRVQTIFFFKKTQFLGNEKNSKKLKKDSERVTFTLF